MSDDNDIGFDYTLRYFEDFFQEKLNKYDRQAKDFIYKVSKQNNVSLYKAYESLWNYHSEYYNQEGQKIWNKGKRYVYLERSGGCAPFLCDLCEEYIKTEDLILHHPKGYGFDHYNHIFSSAVIVHKKCHKRGIPRNNINP